jgi:LPS-assembly protein
MGHSMRSLSLRAIFSLSLMFVALLCGPAAKPSLAQPGITVGCAVEGAGLIASPELVKEIGLYLQNQLSLPVKVRNFTSEDFLYDWLSRYREVDFAWMSEDFLEGQPAGEVSLLVDNLDHFSGSFRGSFVARQGLKMTLVHQVKDVLLRMHDNPEGRSLLTKLEVSRFISSARGQTQEGEERTPAQSEQPEPNQAAVAVVAEEAHVELAVSATTEPLSSELLQTAVEPSAAEIADTGSKVVIDSPKPSVNEQPLEAVEEVRPEVKEGKSETTVATEQATTPEHEGTIDLVADYLAYNSEDDSYEAKGDVILRQADVELKSETLLWQAATQDAEAKGAVQLEDAGTSMSGSKMQYNMATGQGQVSDGRVLVREGNFHLAGQLIEKEGQADYFVKEGSFTTCDGEIPDWKVSCQGCAGSLQSLPDVPC